MADAADTAGAWQLGQGAAGRLSLGLRLQRAGCGGRFHSAEPATRAAGCLRRSPNEHRPSLRGRRKRHWALVALAPGLFAKPWLEEGAPTDMRGMSTTLLPASKVGLGSFSPSLARCSRCWSAPMSCECRRGLAAVALPRVLWFNTAMLVLSSIALYSAERAAHQGWMDGVRGGVLAAGVTALVFLIGQLLAWRQLMAEGYFLSANPANAFFYLITALHGMHVAGGLSSIGPDWSEGLGRRSGGDARRLSKHRVVRHVLALPACRLARASFPAGGLGKRVPRHLPPSAHLIEDLLHGRKSAE